MASFSYTAAPAGKLPSHSYAPDGKGGWMDPGYAGGTPNPVPQQTANPQAAQPLPKTPVIGQGGRSSTFAGSQYPGYKIEPVNTAQMQQKFQPMGGNQQQAISQLAQSFQPAQVQQQQPAQPLNIQTSITPENIYSEQQTQRYLNEERSRLAQQNNPSFLKKQFSRPGSSLGWGQAAAVAPQMAELQSQSVGLGAAIPFGDMQSNTQHLRQGQQARDQEALGLATIGQAGQFSNSQNDLNNQSVLLRLLQGLT